MIRRQKGVTLLEVLLAAVIVGTGIAAALSAISTSIRADRHADALDRAARLIDLELGRIEGGFLPVASAAGDFTQDGEPEVSYTVGVADTLVANLEQVTITVNWTEGNTPMSQSVVRLLYQDPQATTNTAGAGAGGSASGGSAFKFNSPTFKAPTFNAPSFGGAKVSTPTFSAPKFNSAYGAGGQ